MSIKALILCGDGINCEAETAFALEQAGASTEIIHINALISRPEHLTSAQILALPGGFSFGDEVSSGKILALKLQYALGEQLNAFIEKQNLVVGICNGFQALVKLGLLPKSELGQQQVTLTHNRQRRFMNKWVDVEVSGQSLFFEGLGHFQLPIRHGEGNLRVRPGSEEAMAVQLAPSVALKYCEDVNGAFLKAAALVNETGTVMGMMPHPEAFIRWTHHPAWTSLSDLDKQQTPPGLRIFQNMIQALRN